MANRMTHSVYKFDLKVNETIFISPATELDHPQIKEAFSDSTLLNLSALSLQDFLQAKRVPTQYAIRKEDKLIGMIGFKTGDVKWGGQYTLSLQFWITPTMQRQGIMSQCLPLFIEKIIFDWFVGTVGDEIKAIQATVFTENKPACQVLLHSGFLQKVHFKGYIKKNGKLYDEYLFERIVDRQLFKCDYPLFGTYHLRRIRHDDAENSHKHRLNPNMMKYLASRVPLSFKETFDDIIQQSNPESLRLAICDSEKLIGMVGLSTSGEEFEEHMVEIGYWLAESYWVQGIVGAAIDTVINRFIKEFVNPILGYYKFERICAYALEANSGSRRVLEKNGFEYHGCTTNSFWKDGVHYNDTYFSRLL